ncbi:hypothetical protein M422DRAFT_210408 [Sphaerobolus stellatus SS14]|uniref:Mitochondrial import inner membrane translocase subunit TIM16 n=1 Tax=Sphaerobolus stellatus (strain SS14) TaxID=990650 RepID=A0A0C9VDM5_SPHS4|nr:hypothetical protein M422DRAFT_210408 [Sphaerobolus stellatus SS14]
MSSPKALVQIVILGSKILGKAFAEAGRQAIRNAKHRPALAASDAAGVNHATSGSPTDKLTREHRMTLDEAHLILNTKKDTDLQQILKNYDHLFKINSLPVVETPQGGKAKTPVYSHYLQSKVVRARERIEAELKVASEGPATETPPPPEPPASETPR